MPTRGKGNWMTKSACFFVHWQIVERKQGDNIQYCVELRQDIGNKRSYVFVCRTHNSEKEAREYFTHMIHKHVTPRG